MSQITAVQVTPRPKQRSFPRTNPAYVGVSKRDGAPSYKKINIEQPQLPTAIYNQRFYDAHVHPFDVPPPSSQTSQSHLQDLSRDKRLDGSDISHSSYIHGSSGSSSTRVQDFSNVMTDSYYSQQSGHSGHSSSARSGSLHSHGSSSLVKQHQHQHLDAHSDSHSSQGSLSQGSLRSNQDRDLSQNASQDSLSTTHSSPRHVTSDHQQQQLQQSPNLNLYSNISINNSNSTGKYSMPQSFTQPQAPPRTKHQKHKLAQQHSVTSSSAVIKPLNTESSTQNEGDYANLPPPEGKVMTLKDLISKREMDQERMSSAMTVSVNTEDSLDMKSGDSMKSNESFSPSHESTKQDDTPLSMRSRSIQDSNMGRG